MNVSGNDQLGACVSLTEPQTPVHEPSTLLSRAKQKVKAITKIALITDTHTRKNMYTLRELSD